MGKRFVAAAVAVASVVGMKFYAKGDAYDKVQARLVELCEGDTQCTAAVAAHFAACFESSYSLGGRSAGSSFKAGNLVACINDKAGSQYFAYAARK